MKILCERRVEQQLYSCASVLIAKKASTSGASSNLSNQTSFRFLLSRLAGHLAAERGFGEGESDLHIKDASPAYDPPALLNGDFFTPIE